MTSILSLLFLLAIYVLHSLSIKANPKANNQVEVWLKANVSLSKLAACTLLIITISLFICKDGLLAGIFTALIVLMILFSLVIIITPLKVFNYKIITVLFLLSFFIEKFI